MVVGSSKPAAARSSATPAAVSLSSRSWHLVPCRRGAWHGQPVVCLPRFPVRSELLCSPFDRLMLAWTPPRHAVHLTLSLLWPLLRRVPVPAYLRGAWAGYMGQTIPSYISPVEQCLFQVDLTRCCQRSVTAPRCCSMVATIAQCRSSTESDFMRRCRTASLRYSMDGHYAVLQNGVTALRSWLTAHGLHESSR